MKLRSFDLETHLIQPGLLAPPIVCGSAARWEDGRESADVFSAQFARGLAWQLMCDSDVTITGANIPYDLGCLAAEVPSMLPDIYRAFDEQRVYDILIAQALDAIANGHLFREKSGTPLIGPTGKQVKRYSLDICTRLNLGRADAKALDFWRLRYAILQNVPIENWPFEAQQYPKDDAWNTVENAARQLGLTDKQDHEYRWSSSGPECDACGSIHEKHTPFRNLDSMPEQVETAFALHLGAMWGLRTDPKRVAVLESRVEALHAERVKTYQAIGFIRADGTEDGSAVKRAVARAYGASGECETCKGTGRARKIKTVPCKGAKAKGRFQGCGGEHCSECGGLREMSVKGNEVICENCDGTGFDLSTAPTLPRTDKGKVSASRDTLVESGDDTLAEYGDDEFEKVRTAYIPFVKQGLDVPLTLSPNVLVESNRTSYDGVIQLIPRTCPACARKEEGCLCVRPCFIARPGRVFGSTDYAALELCTLAQCCLWVVGASAMADAINASKDPGSLHTLFAAKMVGCDPTEFKARVKAGDKIAKGYRQAAKAANFGFPGGMGAARLVLSKRKRSEGMTEGPDGRKYPGIRFCILVGGARECGTEKVTVWKKRDYPPLCRACVEVVEHQIRPAYLETWAEVPEYFDWVKRTIELNGEIPSLVPDGMPVMIRGGVDFCNGANNGFQHLAARGGKHALRKVTREAYLDTASSLYRGVVRVPMFVHDELFTEGAEDTAHEWGPRVAEVMIAAMKEYVPDVHISAETALMRAWYKDAEPKYADGRLVVWEPK